MFDPHSEQAAWRDDAAEQAREESPLSYESLKVEINNFIWMHGPPSMTLVQAEELALKILNALRPEA